MSIHQHTCYVPACDMTHDHDHYENFDDGEPHFTDPDTALAWVLKHADWTLIDGVLRCAECSFTFLCERDGHIWKHCQVDRKAKAKREYCERCQDTRYLAIA